MSTPNPVPAAPSLVDKVVAFVKAHYVKVVAAVVGFAVSNFGVFTAIVGIVKKFL